jgi:hypothetical protein
MKPPRLHQTQDGWDVEYMPGVFVRFTVQPSDIGDVWEVTVRLPKNALVLRYDETSAMFKVPTLQ